MFLCEFVMIFIARTHIPTPRLAVSGGGSVAAAAAAAERAAV